MHLKSIAVIFSNKNQSSSLLEVTLFVCMSACRCTVASYEDYSLYGCCIFLLIYTLYVTFM